MNALLIELLARLIVPAVERLFAPEADDEMTEGLDEWEIDEYDYDFVYELTDQVEALTLELEETREQLADVIAQRDAARAERDTLSARVGRV